MIGNVGGVILPLEVEEAVHLDVGEVEGEEK